MERSTIPIALRHRVRIVDLALIDYSVFFKSLKVPSILECPTFPTSDQSYQRPLSPHCSCSYLECTCTIFTAIGPPEVWLTETDLLVRRLERKCKGVMESHGRRVDLGASGRKDKYASSKELGGRNQDWLCKETTTNSGNSRDWECEGDVDRDSESREGERGSLGKKKTTGSGMRIWGVGIG